MFLNSLPIASALIAGVIVIVVDWKNSASSAPQNQLHLCRMHLQKKVLKNLRWWAARCYAGLAHKAVTAKSIALRRMHLQKKLHGGLRCEKRGCI